MAVVLPSCISPTSARRPGRNYETSIEMLLHPSGMALLLLTFLLSAFLGVGAVFWVVIRLWDHKR